jgi:glycosyltransferase involved in cell wall biosynthesis
VESKGATGVKILITAVGHRTEHWTDLFAVLGRIPELELTVAVADVSPGTVQTLGGFDPLHVWSYVLPHRLGEARTGHMASVLFRRSAFRALDGYRPDVIHIIGEASYLSTRQVIRWGTRRWPGVPITLYAAQNIVMKLPVPFNRLELRTHHAVDHAFPITPAALTVLRAKGYRGPATIVPLGVDTTVFTPGPPAPPQRRFTVGFVGRLEPHKGVRELLTTVEQLDADLVVVGRGSLSPAVREFAARRPSRVTLRDWADHTALPALIAQMDVLVLPSVEVVQRNVVPWIGIPLREQFGRVLVEAMACGVPVVGSDVGEIPYVIGDAGLTFPGGDLAGLTERLQRLRDQPALREELAARGRKRALTVFGWDRAADRMWAVWQSLSWTAPAGRTPRPHHPQTTERTNARTVTTS